MRSTHHEAQHDISELLRSAGSEVVDWGDAPGPGETDIEAYWPTGAKWLLQVREKSEVAGELGKLRLRATSMGATPVLALVMGEQVEFHSAVDDALLELPEDEE